MKLKTIITTLIILFSLSCFSQQKKDTIISLTFIIKDYRELANKIDAAIDSKKVTSDIWFWIDSRAILIPPKQDTLTNKIQPKK